VSGCSTTGSGSRKATWTPSSLILFFLLKIKATMGADVGVRRQVLAAFRTGESELSTALGTGFVLFAKGAAAVRTQVNATGGAFLILLADWLTALPAEGRPFYLRLGLLLGFLQFLFVLLKAEAAMGTDVGVRRQVFAAFRTGKGELGTTGRAGFVFLAKRAAAVGAKVYATGGAVLIFFTYWLATVGADGCPLDHGLGHLTRFVGYLFVLFGLVRQFFHHAVHPRVQILSLLQCLGQDRLRKKAAPCGGSP
jgi:hypothetical protein